MSTTGPRHQVLAGVDKTAKTIQDIGVDVCCVTTQGMNVLNGAALHCIASAVQHFVKSIEEEGWRESELAGISL